MALIPLLALTPHALAACVVSQTRASDGIEFDIAVDGSCPAVTVVADRDADVRAWGVIDSFQRRIPKEQVLEHPWLVPALGWRITAPLLGPEDHLIVRLTWDPTVAGEPHVDVILDGSAPRIARGGTADQVWTYVPNPRHPEWGFTDPKFGKMERRTSWTFGEEGEPGWLDGPGAAGSSSWWPGGPGIAQTLAVDAPAPALGEVTRLPGSLTIHVPAGVLHGSSDEGAVTAQETLEAAGPVGGPFRWNIESIGGIDIVGDDVRFVAGQDSRFRAASLPEPSVPLRLRGNQDGDLALRTLWGAVRGPVRGVLGDAGHPRPLNRAWRSGWLTDDERALVLLRFLGQERIPARWVLTGAHPDPTTFVGFDHMLIAAALPGSNQVIWLDPACTSCGIGEIDPALSGRPAVGGADHVPTLSGTLVLTSSLLEGAVETRVTATGNGARFIRTSVGTVGDRSGALARLFGVASPTEVRLEGWDADIQIVFISARAPRPVDLPEFAG